MPELEAIYRSFDIKRHNPIEFGRIGFILTSTLFLYGNQYLVLELEGGDQSNDRA